MNSTLAKLIGVGLITLCFTSFTAQADFILIKSVPGPAFTFTAICYDCTSNNPGEIGEESIVTGTLTLTSTYQVGTEFDLLDFFSFTYDGLSNHVEPFSYARQDISYLDGQINSDGSFRINLEGSKSLNLCAPGEVCLVVVNSNEETLQETGFPHGFYVEENGDWELTVGGGCGDNCAVMDFGSSAIITTVTAPSTIALFAFGLMGLASRRFKKQA